MTTYPSCISDSEICNNCYASESCTTGYYCRESAPDCMAYCNTDCNTVCNECQTFCELGVETVVDHADVHSWNELVSLGHSEGCFVKDQIIFRNWTAALWNGILMEITSNAGTKGLECAHTQSSPNIPVISPGIANPDPCNDTHIGGSLITADKYNVMADTLSWMRVNVAHVKVGDVIRGLQHATEIMNKYNDMQFNTDVCDVCNAEIQNRNDCNCSCDCSCGCGGCSCSCSNSGMN